MSIQVTGQGGEGPRLSVVTPAYNEAESLPHLYERLRTVLNATGEDWEWIVVDDHSSDGTRPLLANLVRDDPRVKAVRLSRNFGSHIAIACGLQRAGGDCVTVLAADLQDPPEEIPRLLKGWRDGHHIVWAVRARREGETWLRRSLARLYYALMRRTSALEQFSATGADFFLIDRRVVEALNRFSERHVSILALITWMGFRQISLSYDKQERCYGRSRWTLKKQIKLLLDTVTSFTYFPIRLMSYLGLATSFLGFCYAGIVVLNRMRGVPIEGWTSLMVVLLVLGGLQMLMLGVLGEYLWRALDDVRGRPRYLVEEEFGADSHGPSVRS